jgi:uncharacterized protein
VTKILFWLVVVFAVLFALRLYNANKAKRRGDAAREAQRKSAAAGDPMVRCARCGVFLPRADATAVATGGYVCSDPSCNARR